MVAVAVGTVAVVVVAVEPVEEVAFFVEIQRDRNWMPRPMMMPLKDWRHYWHLCLLNCTSRYFYPLMVQPVGTIAAVVVVAAVAGEVDYYLFRSWNEVDGEALESFARFKKSLLLCCHRSGCTVCSGVLLCFCEGSATSVVFLLPFWLPNDQSENNT